MNPGTQLAVLQLFSVCFCHLRGLVIVIPRSHCCSVDFSCWFSIVQLCYMLLWPMCITAHLSKLKLICQVFPQSTSLLRSSCNSRTSSGCLELWQSFVSSANMDILLTMPLSRSLMRWGKAVGPEHLIVVHLMSLVSSCWRFGWCKPVGAVLLTSSGAFLSGSHVYLAGNQVYLAGSQVYLAGNQVYLSGSQMYLAGSQVYLAGSQVYLSGSQVYMSGSQVYPPCSKVYLSGSQVYLADSQMYLAGSQVYLSGSQVYLSGSQVYLAGSQVYLSGSQVYLLAVRCILPGVRCICPAIRGILPAVRCILPAVRCTLPAVRCTSRWEYQQ